MNQTLKKIRIWLFLTTLLLVLPLFSSCASSSPKLDPDSPVVLTIWHHYLAEQKLVFDTYIDEFNRTTGKEKGIVIKAYSMDNSGDIHQKIIQAANNEPGAPKMPDMATVYPDTAYTLYNMGQLVPVEKYMEQKRLDQYVGSFLEEGRLTDDSGICVFPIAKSTELLFINNTVYSRFLEDYNRRNPANPLSEEMLGTFEGIMKTAQAYYSWTDAKTPGIPNDGAALFGYDAVSNFAVVGYRQLEDSFFRVHGQSGAVNLASPAFEKIWDFYYVPMALGYFGAYSFYRSEDVQTGDLVMYTGSTAGANFFPKTVTYQDNTKLNAELKVLPYPVFEGGKKAAAQQGAGVAIIKSTPEKEYAATIFLEWFTEPQRNTAFVLNTGYLPVTKEALDHVLPQELDKLKNVPEYANVLKVIHQALAMMKNYQLYSYKPFEKCDKMRRIFEDRFLAAAQEGRKTFARELAAGKDFGTVVKDITAKDRFERFIVEVDNEISKAD
ncbi:extracellular solute-binding protein [Candidatus Formimonas warabiya]|uniref:Extracellular solute-binding protein n=1 Tax=Formimonas warabiya TaxID=1761012 RepID=A0A3G1KSL6_FORW1|nr:extracellular solute-binding protein [Candidatus Formimonas warabiya]ATW25155.1 hypothetical protein DCMF_10585 [Candidatus Formimonas warabiya]